MGAIIMMIFLFLISALFIFMGLIVLIRKRPLIISSRWFLAVIALCFIPQIINATRLFAKDPMVATTMTAMYIVLFIFLGYALKGFVLFGIDGDDFQKVFIDNLKLKNFEFEQTLSTIKIVNPELLISIAIQQWIGSGQIRLKSKANKDVFNSIIKDIQKEQIKINKIAPIAYIALGVLMLAFFIAIF